MSDGKKYYCFCSSNCKYETMTKEQILSAIAQAIATGRVIDPNGGYITALKEQNSGSMFTVWVGTTEQYNAIAEKETNCLYIKTDDSTFDDLIEYVKLRVDNVEATAAAAVQAVNDVEQIAIDAGSRAIEAMTKANEALVYANKYKSIDFTDEVALSWVANSGGVAATQLDFAPLRYEYNPVTGIVHFAFKMAWAGKLNKGEVIEVRHVGNEYLPNLGYENNVAYLDKYPMATSENYCTAVYGGEDPAEPNIYIRVNEDVEETQYTKAVTFSGWYFFGADNGVEEE